ncbi:AAA family ATPase [Sphingomonas oligophenolica]|uniref:Uncharacterized protein n=1 Tax=Sphingomonas oligophenolica TaxID=301154 RepID=A0A502CM35_9SPHN|nr:AAA family ATPase [Sphingomonas oligophenolica]TPG13199.1 hypothetical protein EAH84_07315 [Sphingomonas oligophenolica]
MTLHSVVEPRKFAGPIVSGTISEPILRADIVTPEPTEIVASGHANGVINAASDPTVPSDADIAGPNPAADAAPLASDRWDEFGFASSAHLGTYRVPAAVVVFETHDQAGRSQLSRFLADMEMPPRLIVKLGELEQLFYRLSDPALATTLARSVPEHVRFVGPTDQVELPSEADWQLPEQCAQSIDDLSRLTAVEVSRVAKAETVAIDVAMTTNPLTCYSLRGESQAFREQAIEATPLLGDLCLNGQVTVWFAAPNAGKTLIALNLLIEAVRAGRIAGHNAYYVNADDGSEGMATKMELMDDLGVHTLSPGFREFKANLLVPKLIQMAERDEARGVFVLVDTAKKFTSLMDKKLASAYGDACRQVAMRGGAVLNLAHVNKAPKPDGTPQFAGTTDLVDDADAAYMLSPVEEAGKPGEKIVEFRNFKRRGDNAQSAAFGYAAEDGVGYVERLSSVRPIDLDTLDNFKRVEIQRVDEDVVAIIAACIADGHNTKMVLGKEAADRGGITGREAYRIIERYTGDDPLQHRWQFTTKARGAKVFALLPPPG